MKIMIIPSVGEDMRKARALIPTGRGINRCNHTADTSNSIWKTSWHLHLNLPLGDRVKPSRCTTAHRSEILLLREGIYKLW